MSRSHAVLVAALLGVAGLAGIARLATGAEVDARGDDDGAVAESGVVADTAGSADEGASSGGLADEVRAAQGLEPVAVIDPDCTLSIRLQEGVVDPEVACLESQLIAAGVLFDVAPDEVFDADTAAGVRAFQEANELVVDGVVGPETARQLGAWTGPDVLPPDPDTCPPIGRAAVVDRFHQRAWLCEGGDITQVMPITSAVSQPDPGTYQVYAKDLNASSSFSGEYSTMTHFVAFTYGEYQGARIAFHSVPKYPNGEYVQPLDSVGSKALFGESSGCIRVLPEHAALIWRRLDIGDTVRVVT